MIYVFFAQGFEEVEGIATVDVLRRAKLPVKLVGVGSEKITGSHGITVFCDCEIDEITPNDELKAIVLPGGMPGTVNLEKSILVQTYIDFAIEKKILICAICAAPIILGHKGILNDRDAICFPGFESDLVGARISKSFVCKDGMIITAKGMGAAIDFGLEIAKHFVGETTTKSIRETLQCP
ncbi:MAG: DJ-1 family glyoxalase III [Eubacteriales bacterium]